METTATVEEKKQKKVSEGATYYLAWCEWCKANAVEPNVESLRDWDERHNGGRIRALYTDEQVWDAGVYEVYRRFLYSYCMHLHRGRDGKPVRLATIRVIDDDGTFGFVDSCDAEAREFILTRLKARVTADSRRLNLLGMEWRELRREILAAYQEARKAAR